MPELPEVETMRRGVLPVVGSRIRQVEQPPCTKRPILFQPPLEEFDRRCRGRRITAVDRVGKRVVMVLEDGQAIVIEPRMTGLVLLADPPTDQHLRVRLWLEEGVVDQLMFWDRRGLGTIRLLDPDQMQQQVRQRLGVDALQITAAELRARLGDSRREIKVALLDQAAVAGIGNLYAAEILFVAGIDPRTHCDRMTGPQWRRLEVATRQVLEEAIRYEGSTLADGTYRNALNGEGGYQHHHRVYARAGITCPRCGGGPIRRIVQAQRSTFFCPGCQRKRGAHVSIAAH